MRYFIWPPFHRLSALLSYFICTQLLTLRFATLLITSWVFSAHVHHPQESRLNELCSALVYDCQERIMLLVVDLSWEVIRENNEYKEEQRKARRGNNCLRIKTFTSSTNTAVVKMSKLSRKWPGKYLLNVAVRGFSEALKLSE